MDMEQVEKSAALVSVEVGVEGVTLIDPIVWIWCAFALINGDVDGQLKAVRWKPVTGGSGVKVDHRIAYQIGLNAQAFTYWYGIAWTEDEKATLRKLLRMYQGKKYKVSEDLVRGVAVKLRETVGEKSIVGLIKMLEVR